ncbi:MAG: methyltransferase domain-containing protein [Gemmatimonadales bacterium]|nr:methyltransferase domain-containing protein [Gemmatimonadales bacterium]
MTSAPTSTLSPSAAHPSGTELLDDPQADPDLVRINLGDLARANRWFGGWAAVKHGLTRVLRQVPGSCFSLLDVGPGAADLSAAAVNWGTQRGITILPVGIEQNRTVARYARARGLRVARGRGGALPLADDSVDLVMVSQVAHHLERLGLIELFRECDRVARRAVIVADLRRSGFARAAFAVGGRLLRFHPVTLADGETSIRRGYTPAELDELLHAAGVDGMVTGRPFYRLVAVWRPRPT